MGRVVGTCAAYFWYSKSKNKRASWFFPSRKECEAWRNQKWYAYARHGALEFFLADVPDSRKVREREIWIRHKAGYNDLEMRVARVKY